VTKPSQREALLSAGRKIGAITGFFAVVGPPIGGAVGVLWALVTVLLSGDLLGFGFTLLSAVFLLFYAAVFSYPFGLLPSTLAGIVVGTAQPCNGRPLAWPIVIFVGSGAGFIDILVHPRVVALLSNSSTKAPTSLGIQNSVFLVAICIVSTFVCWRFVRDWYTPQSSTEQRIS
jgi:hypothetical protein